MKWGWISMQEDANEQYGPILWYTNNLPCSPPRISIFLGPSSSGRQSADEGYRLLQSMKSFNSVMVLKKYAMFGVVGFRAQGYVPTKFKFRIKQLHCTPSNSTLAAPGALCVFLRFIEKRCVKRRYRLTQKNVNALWVYEFRITRLEIDPYPLYTYPTLLTLLYCIWCMIS